MITNEILRSIRLIALENVTSDSIESYIERAYRHYSKTYHTPLLTAKQTVNMAEVVLIYMEDEALDLPPEELEIIKNKLLNPPTPMIYMPEADIQDSEELDDDAWVAQQIAIAEKKEKEEKAKTAKPAPKESEESIKKAHEALENLYKKLGQEMPKDMEGAIAFGDE